LNLLKKLASDTAIYGLSSIVSRLLNYFLVPLHTGFFLSSAYGEIGIFYANAAFFNVLYTFGMETTYFRYVTKDKTAQQQYFNTTFTCILVIGVVLSSGLWLLAGPIATLIEYPDHARYVQYFALIFLVDSLTAIPYARLRLENKAKRFAALKTLSIVLNVALNFFFLYFCDGVWANKFLPELRELVGLVYDPANAIGYVFLANLLANALQLPFLLDNFKGFSLTVNWAKVQPLLAYAYPLMLMGLAGMVNETIDRNLLKYWLPDNFYPGRSSDSAVGIYSACYKLSIFISLAIQAFRYSAEPFFFAQSADQKSPELFAKVMKYFVIVLAFMYVAVGANLDLLTSVFLRGKEYREGVVVVPILLLANVFLGIYYNLTIWFKLTGQTYFGTWFSAAGAVVTVVANILLIPILGYLGSAFGHLACYLTLCGLGYYYGQKHYPIPYRVKSAFGYLLLASLLILPAHYFKTGHQWADLGLGIGLTLIFPAVAWVVERKGLQLR